MDEFSLTDFPLHSCWTSLLLIENFVCSTCQEASSFWLAHLVLEKAPQREALLGDPVNRLFICIRMTSGISSGRE
jgi:hypothetical protein